MNIDDIIKIAAEGSLSPQTVDAVCADQRLILDDLFNTFAQKVAEGYLEGTHAWSLCDQAMTNQFSYACLQAKRDLPAYAREVFHAFDEDEYIHHGDSKSIDGEQRTHKLLAIIGGNAELRASAGAFESAPAER